MDSSSMLVFLISPFSSALRRIITKHPIINISVFSQLFRMTPNTAKRILRQSTLPNPDASYQSNNTLKLPISPKQQLSPQYSPIQSYDIDYSSDQLLSEVYKIKNYTNNFNK